jgi:hypothetical protein
MNDIEITIYKDQAKAAVSMRDTLARLMENKDYKLIFDDELFTSFAAECVRAKGHVHDERAAAIDRDIAMIGILQARLSSIITLGNQMEQSLAAMERGEHLDSDEE